MSSFVYFRLNPVLKTCFYLLYDGIQDYEHIWIVVKSQENNINTFANNINVLSVSLPSFKT